MIDFADIENDIFISYGHIDNEPAIEGEKGWVTTFHESLAAYLAQRSGEKPRIWRDAKLGGGDFFDDEISQQLSKTAILISILSPRYIKSDACLSELKEFIDMTEQSGGIRFGNKSRIFKVLKLPLALDDQPPELRRTLGFEFFEVDKQSKKSRELRLEFGEDDKRTYLKKVYNLAIEICESLEKLKKTDGETRVPKEKTIVYLAETTSDLGEERDDIKAELKDRGCSVLPTENLGSNPSALQEVIQNALKHSAFSIHLIGKMYGTVPEGETKSIVHLQNDLAAERLNDGFSRFIWLPRGLQAAEERQKNFINYLRTDPEAQKGAEVLEGRPLEELKTVLRDKLTAKPSPNGKRPTPSGCTHVYLICDEVDYKDTAKLEEYLSTQNYEVVLPVFSEGKSRDFSHRKFRETHYENLANCDAAIIYYGQCDSRWVSTKIRDFSKTYALGRPKKKEFLAKALYRAAPDSKEKRLFQTDQEALVIENFKKFSPDALKPFVEQIENGRNVKS